MELSSFWCSSWRRSCCDWALEYKAMVLWILGSLFAWELLQNKLARTGARYCISCTLRNLKFVVVFIKKPQYAGKLTTLY